MNKKHALEQYKKMGKNFMTPEVKDYVMTPDNRIVELATGRGIDGKRIWGVSEFEMIDCTLESTRNGQMHNTLISARRHFNRLLGAN